jgi:hypothetical protein
MGVQYNYHAKTGEEHSGAGFGYDDGQRGLYSPPKPQGTPFPS